MFFGDICIRGRVYILGYIYYDKGRILVMR